MSEVTGAWTQARESRDPRISLTWRQLLFGLALLVATPSFGEGEGPVGYHAMTVEGSTRSGTPFRLELRTRAFAPADREEDLYWGTDGWEPRRLVDELRLAVGGRDVRIPREAVNDLADPSLPLGVFLTEEQGRLLVHIKGGDGAAGYEAVLEASGLAVSARRILHLNEEGERVTQREEFRE